MRAMPTASQTVHLRPITREASFMPSTVDSEKRTVQISWSTGQKVLRGGWDGDFLEELSMDPKHIRMERMTSGRAPFTKDHGRGIDNVIGVITSAEIRNGEGVATVKFSARDDADAVFRDVKDGILRNVSATYRVHKFDRIRSTKTDEPDTMRAVDWEPLAVGLVDIGADSTSMVRSADDAAATPCKITGGTMPDPITTPASPAGDAQRDAEITTLRAAAARAQLDIQARDEAAAAGVVLAPAEISACADIAAVRSLIVREMAKKVGQPASPITPTITVTRDESETFVTRTVENIARQFSGDVTKQRGIRPMGLHSLIRACAAREGNAEVGEWDAHRMAMWAMPRVQLQRDAANKSSGQFTSILANVSDLQLLNGFTQNDTTTWQMWCSRDERNDFRQATKAGLASGNLVETAENVAFPELAQAEGYYNVTLGMWGATLSLTYQMMVNDEMGEFMRSLSRAGFIAARTIDRQVYNKLLNATWTNDTSTSVGLGTASNLNTVRTALIEKLDPVGQKMGLSGRFLLHDPSNSQAAEVATGAIYAPGQTGAITTRARNIVPIESHWIGDTALLAGALYTDYYLAGDPRLVDTVNVSFLRGVPSPMIAPYDAGAVAGEKWKIMLPFVATVATHTDSAAAARVSGIQKATA
jgi:hypothetical protein